MIQKSFLQEMLDLQKSSKIKYSTISALGSVLVLISATFPFINNIVAVFAPEINTIYVDAASNNLAAVLWSLAICFQATVIIIANYLKPYLLSYAPALFTSLYSSSFYFLPLLGYTPNENFWFLFYIVFIVLIIVAIMQSLNIYIKVILRREKLIENSLNEFLKEH